jgi:hypothetical protein
MTSRPPRAVLGIVIAAVLASMPSVYGLQPSSAAAATSTGTVSNSTSQTNTSPTCLVAGLNFPAPPNSPAPTPGVDVMQPPYASACATNTATFTASPAPGMINYDQAFGVSIPGTVKIPVPPVAYTWPANVAQTINSPYDPNVQIVWNPKSFTVYFENTTNNAAWPVATNPMTVAPCNYTAANYQLVDACETVPVSGTSGLQTFSLHHAYSKVATYHPQLVVQWQATMPFSLSLPLLTPIQYSTLTCHNADYAAQPAGFLATENAGNPIGSGYVPPNSQSVGNASNYCLNTGYTNTNTSIWTPQVTHNTCASQLNWVGGSNCTWFQNPTVNDNWYAYYQNYANYYQGTHYDLNWRTVEWICKDCGSDTDQTSAAYDTRACDLSGGGWRVGDPGGSGENAWYDNITSGNGMAPLGCYQDHPQPDYDDQNGGSYHAATYNDYGKDWSPRYDGQIETRYVSSANNQYGLPATTQWYDNQTISYPWWAYNQQWTTTANYQVPQYYDFTSYYNRAGVDFRVFTPDPAQTQLTGYVTCPDSFNLSDPIDYSGGVLLPQCVPNYDTRTWYKYYVATPGYASQQPTFFSDTSHDQFGTWQDNQTLNWGTQGYTSRWLYNPQYRINYYSWWEVAADNGACSTWDGNDDRDEPDGRGEGEDPGNWYNRLIDYTTSGGYRNPCGQSYGWWQAPQYPSYDYWGWDVWSQGGTTPRASIQDNWSAPILDANSTPGVNNLTPHSWGTCANASYVGSSRWNGSGGATAPVNCQQTFGNIPDTYPYNVSAADGATCRPGGASGFVFDNAPCEQWKQLQKVPVHAAPLIVNWNDAYQLTLVINQEQPKQG